MKRIRLSARKNYQIDHSYLRRIRNFTGALPFVGFEDCFVRDADIDYDSRSWKDGVIFLRGTVESGDLVADWYGGDFYGDSFSGTWHGGEFHGGSFEGVWDGGDFHGEDFQPGSLWRAGNFHSGNFYGRWKSGQFFDGNFYGHWENGDFLGGIFVRGLWENGTFHNGILKRCNWRDGEFAGGIWEDGRWYGGTWTGGIRLGGKWFCEGEPAIESLGVASKTLNSSILKNRRVLLAKAFCNLSRGILSGRSVFSYVSGGEELSKVIFKEKGMRLSFKSDKTLYRGKNFHELVRDFEDSIRTVFGFVKKNSVITESLAGMDESFDADLYDITMENGTVSIDFKFRFDGKSNEDNFATIFKFAELMKEKGLEEKNIVFQGDLKKWVDNLTKESPASDDNGEEKVKEKEEEKEPTGDTNNSETEADIDPDL